MSIPTAVTRAAICGILPGCTGQVDTNSGTLWHYKGPNYPAGGIAPQLVNFEASYGLVKPALKFDGVNDYINAGVDIGDVSGGKLTLYMWIKQADVSATDYFFRKIGATSSYNLTVLSTSGQLQIYFRNGGSNYAYIPNYSSIVADNTVFLLEIKIDVSQSTDALRLKVKINNNPITLAFSGATPTTFPNLTQSAEIGGRSDSASSLDGDILGCLFYNDVKTDEEDTAIYNLGPTLGGLRLLESGILVEPGPTITTHPENDSVIEGQTAKFTVAATGAGTLHYQWKKDGTDIGTDSDTLSFVTVIGDNGAQITCVVTDDNGNTTSNAATLTVVARVLTSIVVTGPRRVAFNKTKQFTANGFDQLGDPISTGTVIWTATGGTIDETGLFTAGETAGEFAVTATVGLITKDVVVRVLEKIPSTSYRARIAVKVGF
jgi:hypothetical protein